MKKIAFVAPWYGDNIPGGAEAALRGVANHLYEAGVDVCILTTTVEKFTADWNKNYYKPGNYKSASGIPIKRFKIRKRDSAAFDAVNQKLINGETISEADEQIFNREMINSPDLYEYIKKNSGDYTAFVYIPYMFGTTYHGVMACPEKAVLIPCFHDEAYAYLKSFREVYSKAAGMLFNAEPEKYLTEKIYNLSGVKQEVMGLGVDTGLTYDAGRFRDKFNIHDPFILYAGRKDEGKNIYTLINYFKRYKEETDSRLKLVLIGGGEIKVPVAIKNEVIDLGFVDIQDKYDAYSAAELLCQPSKNESFSFVIMESWLCKRPVLVHEDCEVTKNFVSVSNGGLYFRDYYDFRGTVDYIINNPETGDKMAENGYKFVCDNFAWDVIVKKYKKFFEELEEAGSEA